MLVFYHIQINSPVADRRLNLSRFFGFICDFGVNYRQKWRVSVFLTQMRMVCTGDAALILLIFALWRSDSPGCGGLAAHHARLPVT